jgi:hypothetical protein
VEEVWVGLEGRGLEVRDGDGSSVPGVSSKSSIAGLSTGSVTSELNASDVFATLVAKDCKVWVIATSTSDSPEDSGNPQAKIAERRTNMHKRGKK